ncbi:hypothetical protein N665_1330s0001 [Sinapis alba]|nr:hypothetical protein N665_1330s0001 [Sinapis alba]
MAENEESNPMNLPVRIFAVGEEPVGIRVTPYHKPRAIRRIINALDADEVEFLRGSPFGKFVDIAELPSFSGRFGRYIISRQLKVSKRHEAWFLFAGKPIRFSIREFAFVTSMNCSKYPAHSKKRTTRNINEKPYWGELFGTLKDVPVRNVIRMLERKTVTGRETRIKYACLALLASVILPTTHSPRISHDHTEKIKDIDEFFAYPWGRVAFEMLMSSIKERNEISLSQNTIALKGFVLALQLVMIEAVPALTEVVRDGSSSGSEGDFADEEDLDDEDRKGKKSISPAHARDTDILATAQVVPIISSASVFNGTEQKLDWSDDEVDTKVDNLMKLIENGHNFSNELFTGGVSKVDVVRMREEANVDAAVRKTKKQKTTIQVPDSLDAEYIAAVVKAAVKEDITRLEGQLSKLNQTVSLFQSTLLATVQNVLKNIQSDISTMRRQSIPPTLPSGCVGIEDPCEPHAKNANPSPPQTMERGTMEPNPADIINSAINFVVEATNTLDGLDGGLRFENPTFSLGLSQEQCVKEQTKNHDDVLGTDDINPPTDHVVDDFEVPLHAFRKNKRPRVVPKALVGEYACDKRLLNQERVAHFGFNTADPSVDYGYKFAKLAEKLQFPFVINIGDSSIGSKDISQIVERKCTLSAKVVDVLMHHTRLVYQAQSPQSHVVFLDTKFISQLARSSAKFSKAAKKDSFAFPATLCGSIIPESRTAAAQRYYFPFNLDKTHWVGICADTVTLSLVVLDCNIALRTDALMTKELKKIAVMFPYHLRQAAKAGTSKDTKPMNVERPRSVPQNPTQYESALTSVLLIQAHEVAGVEVCKCITPDVLAAEAERVAVMFYEDYVGSL